MDSEHTNPRMNGLYIFFHLKWLLQMNENATNRILKLVYELNDSLH